jgi:hypothetical protein
VREVERAHFIGSEGRWKGQEIVGIHGHGRNYSTGSPRVISARWRRWWRGLTSGPHLSARKKRRRGYRFGMLAMLGRGPTLAVGWNVPRGPFLLFLFIFSFLFLFFLCNFAKQFQIDFKQLFWLLWIISLVCWTSGKFFNHIIAKDFGKMHIKW